MPVVEPAPVELPALKTNKPFSLTISGGISRGAYEAGVNWSIVTALRATRTPSNPLDWQARLDVITGASAGTINTFLSALTWCRPDVYTEAPVDSLFWKAWVPISYGALFQDDFAKVGYDDALFSRGAFKYAIDVVGKEIENGTFRDNCTVQLGTTLTPARAEHLKATNRALEVPAMRFIVPLEMHVGGDKRPRFYNLGERPRDGEAANDDELRLRLDALSTQGPRWKLPEERGLRDISLPNVFSLNYASSAFPAAFGHVCVPGVLLDEKGAQIGAESVCYPTEPARCDVDPKAKCRFFLDGGVFDNVPLFLAVALADKDVRPIYIDPELRRGLPEDVADTQLQFRPRGLNAVVGMLSEAVPAARSYELQFYLRNDPPEDAAVAPTSPVQSSTKAQQVALLRSTTGKELLSDRYAPIVGETVASFGAFYLKEFRAYDFHAGTYDGIVSMARYIACNDSPECDGAALSLTQIVPSLKLVIGTLTGTAQRAGLESDATAVAVIHMLFDDEFAGDPALAQVKALLVTTSTVEPDPLIVALARASLEMRKEDVASRQSGLAPPGAKECGLVGRAVDSGCRLARLVGKITSDASHRFDQRIQSVDTDCSELGFFSKADDDTCPPWRRRELDHAKRFLRPNGFVPWFESEALKIVARAAEIEERDMDAFEKQGTSVDGREAAIAGASGTRRAAVVLDAALRTNAIFDSVGLYTPSSSLSGWSGVLLPQRAMIDIAGGTISPVWRPWTGKPCRWFGVSLDVEPFRLDVDPFFLEPAAALAPRVALVPSYGMFLEGRAGPAYSFKSGALYDDQSLGLDITGELVLFHKLRIGAGIRHWTLASAAPKGDVVVLFGVDDVSGIVAMFVR